MKKIPLVILTSIITFVISYIILVPSNKKVIVENNNEISTNNTLAMMLETEAGSGEYALSNSVK